MFNNTANPLIIGCAALFLATGTAHAGGKDLKGLDQHDEGIWSFSNYKRCTARTVFKVYPKLTDGWPSVELSRVDPTLGPRGGPAPSVLEEPDTATVVFYRKHLAKLEAVVRFLKKCRPCFWDRYTQKTSCLTLKETKELDNAD